MLVALLVERLGRESKDEGETVTGVGVLEGVEMGACLTVVGEDAVESRWGEESCCISKFCKR